MKTQSKAKAIKIGSARRLTKTEWVGLLPEIDNPVMFRNI